MWIRMGSFDEGVFVQAVVAAYCEDLYDGPCVDGVDDVDDMDGVDGEGRMEGGRECEASDPEEATCSDIHVEVAGQSGDGVWMSACPGHGRRKVMPGMSEETDASHVPSPSPITAIRVTMEAWP